MGDLFQDKLADWTVGHNIREMQKIPPGVQPDLEPR
jgi:hypothetical protein